MVDTENTNTGDNSINNWKTLLIQGIKMKK